MIPQRSISTMSVPSQPFRVVFARLFLHLILLLIACIRLRAEDTKLNQEREALCDDLVQLISVLNKNNLGVIQEALRKKESRIDELKLLGWKQEPKDGWRLDSALCALKEEICFLQEDRVQRLKLGIQHLEGLKGIEDRKARIEEIWVCHRVVAGLFEAERYTECADFIKLAVQNVKISGPTRADASNMYEPLDQLGFYARELNMLEEALCLCRHAKEMQTSIVDDEKSAVVWVNLGCTLLQSGQLLEAEKELKQAYVLLEMRPSLDERLMGSVMNNLGDVYESIHSNTGEESMLNQAEEAYRKAYELTKKVDGDRSGKMAIRLGNLASILAKRGKWEEALLMAAESIGMYEEFDGKTHTRTLQALRWYGEMNIKAGNIKKGEEILKQALDRTKSVWGDVHENVAAVYSSLGDAYIHLGQYSEAEFCYERTTGIYERSVGKTHEWTVVSYFMLGKIRDLKEDYAGAAAYFEHVLSLAEKSLGKEHADYALAVSALAHSLIMDGQMKMAEQRLNQYISFVEKKFGKDSPIVAGALTRLANLEEKLGRFDKAEQLLIKSLEIRTGKLGRNHIETGAGHAELAMFFLSRKKLENAQAHALRAAVIFSRQESKDLRVSIGYNFRHLYETVLRERGIDANTIQKHLTKINSGLEPSGEISTEPLNVRETPKIGP